MSRNLLALLLARANRPVSGAQLIEELWGEASPPSAKGALRVHLSHLRSALAEADPEGPGRIEATAAGYTLTVGPDELDASRFELAYRTARQAADAGAADEVRDRLEVALGWWRGPAYEGLEELAPLAAEAVRLEELRLRALETLADAHLSLGRPEAACELLTGVATDHPWRESVTERLMLALYRSGRPSDALRAFSRLREALDAELGIAPGASVRALEESIVVQRPELDLTRASSRASTVSVPEALPIVGRRTETAAIERIWRDRADGRAGLVLVSGPAGIGKTTLVERATAPIEAAGADVLIGRCDPEPSSDYEPLPQLIRAALKLVDAEHLDLPILGELSRLVPDEAARLPTPPPVADASTGRLRLFTAVPALFELLAPTPIVLVAEDLHWAGRDAFAVLRQLLQSFEGPMLIIATYRDDELPAEGPAAEALTAGRLSRPELAIRLDGLDRAELNALVRAWGPADLRSSMLSRIDALRDLTAGNPMFVREVLREVAESPEIPDLDSLAPGGVRALVERRLARLPETARSALSVAAVLGRRILRLPARDDRGHQRARDARRDRRGVGVEARGRDRAGRSIRLQPPTGPQHDLLRDHLQPAGPAPPPRRRDAPARRRARGRAVRGVRPSLCRGAPAR